MRPQLKYVLITLRRDHPHPMSQAAWMVRKLKLSRRSRIAFQRKDAKAQRGQLNSTAILFASLRPRAFAFLSSSRLAAPSDGHGAFEIKVGPVLFDPDGGVMDVVEAA